MRLKQLSVSDVRVGKRCRKDVGDLTELRESIQSIGLLHPIVVTKDNHLVAGYRRLVAFKRMGRDKIPAHIASSITDVVTSLDAERHENICRLDFTLDELGDMALAMLAVEKPKAEAARRDGGKKAGRGRPIASDKLSKANPEDKRAMAIVAKAIGKSRSTVERILAVKDSGDEKLIAEMNRTGKVNGVAKRLKVERQAKELEAKPAPMPTGKFDVIVADPPWHYEARAKDPSHRAANPYPSMSLNDIAKMPIAARAEENCTLWLWTTNSHIPDAWGIVEAWGFKYKTILTWAKHKMGTGDWLRGQTEHCLLCVRGKPTIRLTNQTTLLNAKSGPHSAKPDEFYGLVEQLCPGTKLELFSRSPREGWVGFGDECK